MDFVRQQLAVVQDRLAGLSASQKMLTAALAVIVVMTMLYWGKVSSTPERVAVVPNALAGDELAAVTNALRARGIDYTVEAGKVMVAADKQVEAFGELSFSQALPASSTNAIDTMFEHVTAWDSQGAFDARLNNAKQQNIAAVLRAYPGVKKADVLITDAPNSALSHREPRAAISFQTKGGDADRRKIAASARTFALNCVAGLSDKFLSVTVDMQTFGGDANGVGGSGDVLEIVRNFEAGRVDQIREQLSSIPGVLVQVTAEMDTSTKKETTHKVDPKNKYAEVIESEHKTSTPVAGAAPAQEPGVVANTTLDARASNVASSGTAGGVATEETTEKSVADVGRTDLETNTPGGACHLVGAVVGVPQSYLVAVWQKLNHKSADVQPTDDELRPVHDRTLKNVRDMVVALTKLKGVDDITVSDYVDLESVVGGPTLAAIAPPGAAGNLTLLATGHARELALGVLAITSLFMVSRMVKKAAPSPLAGVGGLNLMVADDAIETVGGPTIKRSVPKSIGGEEVAAEVGDGGAVMFGHELDADVLETSQMIEQVSGFVKQNPDAAAQMIGRWMNHD